MRRFNWYACHLTLSAKPRIPTPQGVLEEGIAWGVASAFLWDLMGEISPLTTMGDRLMIVWGTSVIMFGFLLVSFRFLYLCFWLLELLWTLTLHFLRRKIDPALALQYLPFRFDECIILPLPFMGQMIVEAYRENPPAVRETIDYLITSTNQQNVAAWAMTGIAVNSLSSCQSIRDIADITEELAWIPSPPPKQLGSVLPQLLDISQDVQASVEATSPYRQSELLNPPANALRELLNRLAFRKNHRLITTFGSIAKGWLTILETAQCTLEEQGRYSKEIRQVYIAGNALDPQTAEKRFKGRIDLFREMKP